MSGETSADRQARRQRLKRLRSRIAHLPPLSPPVRVLLLLCGILLVLLGLAGLALPVLQGIVFLTLGAAVLSLVSSRFLHWLRRLFRRWPRGWRTLLRFRRRVHGWFS